MAPLGKLKTKKRGLKGAEEGSVAGKPADGNVDQASVFIRGLPKGTADGSLRAFMEARVGPTSQCFMIRDDYGLVKFRDAADARRCLEDLQGVDFQGSSLKLQAAKPKRSRAGPAVAAPPHTAGSTPAAASSSSGGKAGKAGRSEGSSPLDIRSVQLVGAPKGTKKEAVQAWIEEKLPGGCGIERVQRSVGKAEDGKEEKEETFVVHFRKDLNAKRAVDVLEGAELKGHTISATFRALELSRTSGKAGRLIVRNLSFSAGEKHVRKAFQTLGALTEVSVPSKEGSAGTMNRGFAFVQFADSAVAQKAVDKLNGSKICGRGVAVDWAVQSELYTSLQREEKQERAKAPKQAKESSEGAGKADKKKASVGEDAEEDEEEDAEDEEDEEGEEEDKEEDEEAEEEKVASNGDTSAEVKRMQGLLGEGGKKDAEEQKAADAKAEKEVKPKDKKDLRKPGYDVDEKKTIFVRNVPFDANEEDLKTVLKKYGRVLNVKMVADSKGVNTHRGSAFVKFAEVESAKAALAEEAQADKKLKELSAVVRKSDKRELPAVEGFGLSLKGRRLVLKPAVTPTEAKEAAAEKKPQKGLALAEKAKWKYLFAIGEISENSEKWGQLSKSEQLQRNQSRKERKFRINNPNFVIHPMRLSIRNLPTSVDASKLRAEVVRHLSEEDLDEVKGLKRKKDKMKAAQELISKANLVRNPERRDAEGARRSRGFGFMEFKNHDAALKVLDYLNDNPKAFGGKRRPIVQFAIEDKRKLRMQKELFDKHGHKLLAGKDAKTKQPVQDVKGGTVRPAEASKKEEGKEEGKGEGKGGGKGKGKGKDGEAEGKEGAWNEWHRKKNKHKGESRGRKQREKRRQQKAQMEDKEKRRTTSKTEQQQRESRKKAEEMIKKRLRPKLKSKIPDADASVQRGKKRKQEWEMADDFELKAMEKFRR